MLGDFFLVKTVSLVACHGLYGRDGRNVK